MISMIRKLSFRRISLQNINKMATAKEREAATWQSIKHDEMQAFMKRCVMKVGGKEAHADIVAKVLSAADARGIYSHGINKLEMYCHDILAKTTSTDKEPEVLKEKGATAWVDGNHCLGPVVGTFCMDLAVKKAKDMGIGWVVCKGSTHYGIAGYHAMRATEQGYVGFSFTNTSPFMVPTRASQRALGTNPMSCAANGSDGESFVLDMATTPVAHSKIELARQRGQGIPDGWGVDGKGNNTNDPLECQAKGGGYPLGGKEENGGYKGYGLAMMVEIMCAIMGGATYGKHVRPYKTREKLHDIGQCFIAVDPNCFAPGFEDRLTDLIHQMRGLEKAEGETNILVPGDPEKSFENFCEKKSCIPYHPNQIQYTKNIAKDLDVEAPAVFDPTS